jgi:hypothetical protein
VENSTSNFNGYEAAKIWMASKAHYSNSKYDVAKYNFAWKLDETTFRMHRDRFLFERLAKEYVDEGTWKQAVGYALYHNPKTYLRQLIRPEPFVERTLDRCKDIYGLFKFEWGALSIATKSDLERWIINIDRGISPESVAIVYDYYKDNQYSFHDVVNNSKLALLNRIPKYAAFVGYDRAKVAAIIRSDPV